MDKQIEIQKMQQEIFDSCAWRFSRHPEDYREVANDIGEDLYNLGCRNCKDKVGLTMEEFDEFRKDRAEVIFLKKQIIEQARKETIERFIVEMKASETLSTLLNAGWETFYKMICNDMFEIAKQYNVEIGEEV